MDEAERSVIARGRALTRRHLLQLALASSVGLALGSRVFPGSALAAPDPSGWIALTRNRDVVLTRPDGTDTHSVLTVGRGEFVFDVALSPDGTRLAYAYFTTPTGTGGGGADIMLVSLTPEAGTPTVLAARDGPGVLLGVPGWAPDGQSLVFEVVGFTAAGQPSIRCDTINVDGSGRRTLVEGARYPTLSPDGSSVAYIKSLPTGDALYVRPLAGGAERQIVSDVEMAGIAYPRYAPDGSLIAFAGINLNSMHAPTDDPELLRTALAAPDLTNARPGPTVRGVARHGLPTDPWMVAPDGTGLRRLVQLSGDDLAVAWSPDGQWLAVSGAYGLFLFAVADGSQRSLSEDGSFGALDWR
jgi:Tol biopolymer transport system component